jgi:hypothetical protein
MDVIPSEKRSNRICFDWLFRARNIQTKVVLIHFKREKRSNQSYFDWFRAREMFKPKLFWLIPSRRNVQTKTILIDSERETFKPKIALNDSEREVFQQNFFVWFRVGTVQTQNKWLIASDRNIQSFLQRESVQKPCLLRFPLTALLPNQDVSCDDQTVAQTQIHSRMHYYRCKIMDWGHGQTRKRKQTERLGQVKLL